EVVRTPSERRRVCECAGTRLALAHDGEIERGQPWPRHLATVHSAAMDASPADTSVAVVTGANSGIGRARASHLAEEGHLVFGTVRDKARATKLLAMADERGVEVVLVELDVADDDSVRRGMSEVLDAAGRVDVLVNNAGVGGAGVAEDTDTATYLDTFN